MVYVPPFLLFFGTFGNILIFIVFSGKSLRNYPSSVYFRVLAVFDSLVLMVKVPRLWIKGYYSMDIRLISHAVCKIHRFLDYWAISMSIWTIVCMTIDRCIAVYQPHKYKQWSSKFRTVRILSVVMIIFTAIASVTFVSNNYETMNESNQTILKCRFPEKSLINHIWSWHALMAYTICPVAIILICNISIICRLNLKCCLGVQPSNRTQTSSGIIFILLTISFVFVMCVLLVSPTLYMLLKKVLLSNTNNISYLKLLDSSSHMLPCLNSSINFLLYYISGSVFRRELCSLCCGKCQHGPQ